MKIYNFTRNDYGPNWYVLASNKESAISHVRASISSDYEKERSCEEKEAKKGGWVADYEDAQFSKKYHESHLADCIGGKRGCSIEEINPGVVIFDEVS